MHSTLGKGTTEYAALVNASELQALLMERAEGMHEFVQRRIPHSLRSLVSPDDVLQEVWLAAFRGLSSLRTNYPNAVDRWLMRITEGKVLDVLKEAHRVKRGRGCRTRQAGQRRSTSFLDPLSRVAANQRTPSSEEGAREATHAVQAALCALPNDYREAITMFHIHGRSRAEVAEAMHKSLPAVRGLLRRALHEMRDKLGPATKFFSDPPQADSPRQDVAPPLVGGARAKSVVTHKG